MQFYVLKVLKSKQSVKWWKTINEMDGNIPGENFLGGNFPVGGGSFPGGVWWVEIFRVGIPPVGISLEPFSLFNGSILIFQKIMNKYNKTFNKKIYILIQCRAKFLSRKILFQWAQIIFNSKHVKQRKFWVLNKWSVREKCKS